MKHPTTWLAVSLAALIASSGGSAAMANNQETTPAVAVLGGGCFWCIEAVFEEVSGVLDAESGYAGGHVVDPDYRSVCGGETGHAEVVRVTYDPARVSFEELLLIFFGVHDPTTLDRQGADIGSQYRSIILYRDDAQKRAAEALIAELDAKRVFEGPIVTRVEPLDAYYRAEDGHQDFFRRNPAQGYCQVVIAPKLTKFRQEFMENLRSR